MAPIRQLVAGLAGEVREIGGDLQHRLLVAVLDDRHEEPVRRVDRAADVVVLLVDDLERFGIETAVELRERLQAAGELPS